jgi:hypothetical protein
VLAATLLWVQIVRADRPQQVERTVENFTRAVNNPPIGRQQGDSRESYRTEPSRNQVRISTRR